ncbi:44317_t:CDS:2, partial [Gigaspora margarita]
VTATSIKVINFEFNDMPVLGINSVVVGITNQTVKNIENDLILEFYIEEKNSCSTTAILIGTITYEISTGKHVIILEDIFLITSGRNDSTAQSITLPWLSNQVSQAMQERIVSHGVPLRKLQKKDAVPYPIWVQRLSLKIKPSSQL